nr:alpha/beta fold hydrolase [Micromonospora sp. M71_S20]
MPAVLLAHGFGGTKESVRADAEEFAGRGYAVLTWTARGFGRSGGQIHLDHPDYEVRDAERLLDWLAARPEIRTDAAGDPKVGVVGGSYGGGLALLLAAQDQRVDAIVPMITWNDLSRSFLPESTGKEPTEGVFKSGWGRPLLRRRRQRRLRGRPGSPGPAPPSPRGRPPPPAPPSRGRAPVRAPDRGAPPPGPPTRPAAGSPPTSAPRTCGSPPPVGPDQAAVDLLRRSSPAGVLDRIKARPCWMQGEADTLFPLGEADAKRARHRRRRHARPGGLVSPAGHDGGEGPKTDSDRVEVS